MKEPPASPVSAATADADGVQEAPIAARLTSVAAPQEASPPDAASGETGLLHSRDQRVVATLALCTLILLCVHWLRLTHGDGETIEVRHQTPLRYDYRIDVNTAGVIEWYQLDGIGEALAERIVRDREQNGPFRSVDDLQRVKGIGPATVGKLRPWVKTNDDVAGHSAASP